MKRFLCKILYFILPFIIFAYPIDYIISEFLSKSNYFAFGESMVWNDLYNGKINSDIVIYGSSRAWVQFSPKIIEDSLHMKTYNLGIDGSIFWLQYFRHKELMKYDEEPKHIIMSLDVFSLQKEEDLFNYEQFLPYLLWNKKLIKVIAYYNNNGFKFLDYYIPLIRYFSHKKAFIAAVLSIFNFKASDPYRVNGYKGVERTWNNDFEKAKAENEYYEVKLDTSSVALFEKFIYECKNKRIKLTLVYSPEFIDGQRFVRNREKILKLYRDYSVKYNVDFIDFSNDCICKQKKYFYNAEHLNKTGSEIFTKKLTSIIR